MSETKTINNAVTTSYFIKENDDNAYAYMGDLGLSLSNFFVINKKGQVFFKEGMLGGKLPEYHDPTEQEPNENSISKLDVKLYDWQEGWKIHHNRITSYYSEKKENGTEDLNTVKFSAFYNDHEFTTTNGETKNSQHYICLGSPNINDFTRAVFRITKKGNVYASESEDDTGTDNDYAQGYGNVAFKTTTWRYDANYEDESNVTLDKNKKKKYQTIINPNSIYFFSRQKWNDQNDQDLHSARITYIPGRYGAKTGIYNNGHFIRFSCPIKTNSIYLSDDNIRYITTGVSGISAQFPNERYFYLGPSRDDIVESRYSVSAKGYTVLRGKALNLQAFGDSVGDDATKYTGRILIRANNFLIQNKCVLRAFKQGKINFDVKKPFDTTNVLIRLGTEKDTANFDKDKINEVNAKNRVIVGSANNSAATELRSPTGIYLKTNGYIGDRTGQYIIYFGPLKLGGKNRMAIRPQYKTENENSASLGTDRYRWYAVYTTKLYNSSDERLKEEVESADKYLKLFDALKPVKYKYNKLHTKDEEERNKIHFGFIAQDVKKALEEIGLDDKTFAGIEINKSDENEISYYSLDYTKFVALNTAKIKQLESIIQTQSAQIEKQQQQIDLLLSKLM